VGRRERGWKGDDGKRGRGIRKRKG